MADATMTSEAKALLAKTIRDLRGRLLRDLDEALRREYKLDADATKARLAQAQGIRRARLDAWLDEQLRASGKAVEKGKKGKAKPDKSPERERFRHEVVQVAAYTLLNRLVYLRLLEAAGLRRTPLLAGGLSSSGFRQFRELAPELVQERDWAAYARVLAVVFDELALDLPGLYGRHGLAELVPVPSETLRYVVEQLDARELSSCWTDAMTLGWVYQYWNDPEREALDAKLNAGGKVERHEIASKTQMFTERYMVDWLLQNSLGPMWLAICKRNGWVPHCERDGTLARLEQRRADWRAKRERGEVELTELMPLDDAMERRWAYYVPQPLPDAAVKQAPSSLQDIRLLDPAVGSGHFLVVAFELLVALYREEAEHRGVAWTDTEIVEWVIGDHLYGIDLDPRAVQIAAAALWLEAQRVAPGARPHAIQLVASQLRLANLPDDDPALLELYEAVSREAGLPRELTRELVRELEGADHLGSLLRVGGALDRVIERYRKERNTPIQGSLLDGFGAVQVEVQFDVATAKQRLVEQLEGFLAKHTRGADLGLRLRGEQLAAGVRYLRMLREGQYDVVVGNPPYQGTAKMADAAYVQKEYPRGKADLYAAFLERGLELVGEGGVSALLTMRNWMFIKQYAKLREWLLEMHDLRALGDFAVGAFDDVPNDVLSVVVSVFRRDRPPDTRSVALQPTPPDDTSYDRARTNRKRGAVSCQVGRYEFTPASLAVVPEWPLVYWWSSELEIFAKSDLISATHLITRGVTTGNDSRFLRLCHELRHASLPAPTSQSDSSCAWQYYIKGAAGTEWFEPSTLAILWRHGATELNVFGIYCAPATVRLRDPELYHRIGVSFAPVGSSFSARMHRLPSIFGNMGGTVFGDHLPKVLCAMNSTWAKSLLQSLNPGLHFEVGDVKRLPIREIVHASEIFATLEAAFTTHESHREPSVEFLHPGPSPWDHAQAWAQLAVDRPEGTPLPPYVEQLTPEPATDHLSFALGVALGRFGTPALTGKYGILDPSKDDLRHALPDGILFLDGTLADDDLSDSLGHPACALLHETWQTHRPADSNRTTLRDYLALDFFAVHKAMYENRPIHWPLASDKKTFVAWITIHRWHALTLRNLLANHLHPLKQRLEGQLVDLRAARHGTDVKTTRAAEKQLPKLEKLHAELLDFIAQVGACAEKGPPPAEPKGKGRDQDAPYVPDLDDGVMINSSALWPLLLPHWKDPKKWFKELCEAKGRKDYDWSHLAARYFPERVDGKCQTDPSLAVAHGCFWKYHPARAYAWELRLQDEIAPDFTIDEQWGGDPKAGPTDSNAARERYLAEHAQEAREAREKEHKRRDRKRAKLQGELGEGEADDEAELGDERDDEEGDDD